VNYFGYLNDVATHINGQLTVYDHYSHTKDGRLVMFAFCLLDAETNARSGHSHPKFLFKLLLRLVVR